MTTSSKGAELERKAIDLLSPEGWIIHRTIRTPIVTYQGGQPRIVGSHSNDVFGVFDIVAAHVGVGILWLQVTDSAHFTARQAKVEKVVSRFPSNCGLVEVWGWVGGGKRRDRRYKVDRVFLRRQYFRRVRWRWLRDERGVVVGGEWEDVTPEDDGWIDGGKRPSDLG